jgi:hypothetical protein
LKALKRQVNIAIINQVALSGVILVLFWHCSGYIIVVLSFLAKIFLFCILFYIWNTTWRLDDDNKRNDQSKSVEKQLFELPFSENYWISLMV